MRIFKGHEKSVYSIGVTPDNARLISVGRDDTVRGWDLNTGVVQWQNRVSTAQGHLAISPDGKLVATACHGIGPVFLWNTENGNRVREFPGGRKGWVAFSPDGKELAGVFSHELNVWETAFGKSLTPLRRELPLAGVHSCINYSPDGLKFIGAGAFSVGEYRRGSFGFSRYFEGLHGTATHLTFSHDGRLLCGLAGKHLCVWDFHSGIVVWEELLENRHFQSAAFSPDGRTLATAANTASVRFYDTTSWEMKAEFSWKIGPVLDVTFAPDGLRAAASGRSGKIVVWDVDE